FFTIRNAGSGSLNWTASSSATSFSVAPAGGSTTTETDTVRIHFVGVGLTSESATISVTDPSATNSPQQIIVSVRVGWQFAASPVEVLDASPAIGRDGTVYIASTSTLYAVGSSGAPTWTFPVGGDKF